MAKNGEQNDDKMVTKWRLMEQNDVKMATNGDKMATKLGQNGDKMATKYATKWR